jgi:hypothetical protein
MLDMADTGLRRGLVVVGADEGLTYLYLDTQFPPFLVSCAIFSHLLPFPFPLASFKGTK